MLEAEGAQAQELPAHPPETSENVDEEGQNPQDLADNLSRLEKVVRSVGRDNLGLVRSQKETQTNLQTLLTRFDELELTIKGLAQTTGRIAKESGGQIEKAEEHFAGAIRELEARIREEMKWQLYQSALQAILPALDDLDLAIGNQTALAKKTGEEDGFLEAMILVRQKFVAGLKAIGLEEIIIEEGITQFDSSLHAAVASDIPAELLVDEGVAPKTIIRVRRSGYRFNGRIFRTPQVLIKTGNSA